MNNWKIIFAALVIFGSGVLTGGLLVNHIQHSPSAVASRSCPEPTGDVTNAASQPIAKPQRQPVILSKEFFQRLDKELALSPEQFEAVQKIINEGQVVIRKTIHGSRLEIRETLTPEQRIRFDELFRHTAKHVLGGTNQPAVPATTNAP